MWDQFYRGIALAHKANDARLQSDLTLNEAYYDIATSLESHRICEAAVYNLVAHQVCMETIALTA